MPSPTTRRRHALTIAAAVALALAAGCASNSRETANVEAPAPGTLLEVARSDGYQWTGLAASHDGRIFVCYPRWHEPFRWSVAEIRPDARVVPFPNAGWQSWRPGVVGNLDDRWVCVQSVHVDDADRLWVLDTGSPQLKGVIPGAAKLVQFDLKTSKPVRTYRFDAAAAPTQAYLNDVRVDTAANTAYITDSGLGAIVVLDLTTGAARRVLADHPSTRAQPDFPLVVEGRDLRFPDGSRPQIHADGIALSPDRRWLYYQPISARTLHRVPTSALRDASLAPADLAARVESLGASVVTDGMEFDPRGNLYFSALESDAIVVRRPDGTFETLVTDPRLAWPDSFALGPNNTILVTTAQIHRTPWFPPNTTMPTEPYRVFSFRRAAP
jgi:sugar lactone lactonase YvrE